MCLTDDDLTIIICTSIDQDHLNNLICLNGEFLKWMTTNFAGESREEMDFLDTKISIWNSTLILSDYLINASSKLENKEQMDNQRWWEHIRYEKIAEKIISKLSGSKSYKNELRSIFMASKD